MFKSLLAAIALALALAACSGPATAPAGVPASPSGAAFQNVSPAQLQQMLANKDFFLVNVHVPYAGELAQTDAFIPYTEIEQNVSRLPAKDAKIVLYCSSGHMSGIAANALVKLGYTNVWNLAGGMSAWENAGLPLVSINR